MKKLLLISSLSLLLVTNLFASSCPKGCLDKVPMEKNIINMVNRNYDIQDKLMLSGMMAIANEMRIAYSNLENISARMFEENARLQYMEAVNASNMTLEVNKMNELNSLEVDAQSLKAKENVEVKVK